MMLSFLFKIRRGVNRKGGITLKNYYELSMFIYLQID